MNTYVLLLLEASGSSISEKSFREAINGCRPMSDYKYKIIFITARKAVVAFNAVYTTRSCEECVGNHLARDHGELAGAVVIYQADLHQFSHENRQRILGLAGQIALDGNKVEGF